ncbi:MAG: NAD-dependent epimerase/dehydratase family protein [Acidobacteriota bacterium]
MKALIAGCGDLGTRVGLALAAEGAEVWGIRRNPELLPAPLRGLAVDLSVPGLWPTLPEADLVVYALAADRFEDGAYRRAYVDGVRHLLGALGDRPPRRWLHVSSTSVYAQSGGVWVDESSATEPVSFSGRRILEGEEVLRGSGVAATVLRLSGIYGPGRTRLVDSVRQGRAVCYDPPVHTNRIHVDDAAGALVHLAKLGAPADLYLGTDHRPAPDGEVKRWLAARLGVPEPPPGPVTPGSRAMRSDKRCSNRRLLDSGFRFRYPDYRSGYGELLDR